MSGDKHVVNQDLLVAPNINPSGWTPEMVWDTGFVDSYSQNLAYLAVEQYVRYPSHLSITIINSLSSVTQVTTATPNMVQELQGTHSKCSLLTLTTPLGKTSQLTISTPRHMPKAKVKRC